MSRHHIYSLDMTQIVHEQPSDGIPVGFVLTTDGWRTPGILPSALPVPSPPFTTTFNKHIDHQPEHIAALLPCIRWYCQDVYDFCAQESNLDQIMLVIDRGALETTGSFGWIIGTKNGKQLVAGSGLVFGYDPRSYRAETYGCRSGMYFFQLTFRYCQSTMLGTLTVKFNNQGLLKKHASFRNFDLAQFSSALHSEWDALISVYNLMDRFPKLPVLQHVLGHQDTDLDYSDLPLDAQMDAQANSLATMELNEFSTPMLSIPFDPESRVMFSIDGTTVTR
jgi:hypothetical protein